MQRYTSEGGQTSAQGQEQVVCVVVVFTFHNFCGGGGADENVTFILYLTEFVYSCGLLHGIFSSFSPPLLSELDVTIFLEVENRLGVSWQF